MARFSSTVVVGLLLVCTLMPQADAQTCYALTIFGRIPIACPATAAPATAAPTAATTAAAAASGCPAPTSSLTYCPLLRVVTSTCQSGNGIGLGLIGNLFLAGTNPVTALAGYPAANVQALGTFLTNAGSGLLKLQSQQQATLSFVPLGSLFGK